jgi:hypothetical protein
MSWLTNLLNWLESWLKGIPLNEVLKERLALAEQKFKDLQSENEKLKGEAATLTAENAALKQQLAEAKRHQIAKWRAMVAEVVKTGEQRAWIVTEMLEQQPDFYSLKPHLRRETIYEIHNGLTWLAGSTIGAALSYMLDDIAELEKKWCLS